MNNLIVRRSGTLIDLSPDGQSPLPLNVAQLLHPLLSYEHKTLLRGHQQYGPDGMRDTMSVETRTMYAMEEGRLVTGFGFLTSIVEALQARGIGVEYHDLSPAKEIADVYEPNWDNVRQHIEFRAKQEECLQYIAGNQCGLINATMGFGKTHLIEAICHLYPRARIDIVTRSKDVVARMVRQISRTIPNVGHIGGGQKLSGERVTVYTAGSAHRAEGDADFLLCDEAHQLMTDKTSRVLGETWRQSRNFAFTATPKGRMDGADAQLELFFGREIFKLTYQEAVELGLVVPINVRWLSINLPNDPASGLHGTRRMKHGIWRNDQRNYQIAQDVRTHYPDPDTQILILVATVEHAVRLWQYLPEFALCYGAMKDDDLAYFQRNGYLPPNFVPTTSERREEMRQDFEAGSLKRVIATDVWATGVDFQPLQVLYRVDARESEIMDAQGPGRVSRISPDTGKEVGEVVDCYDGWNKNFRRKSENRKRHYAERGWTQNWPARSRFDA